MRNFQNNISNFGNVVRVVVRQGNQLVVSNESLRSLRASSLSSSCLAALSSYASYLAGWLSGDAWQGPAQTCNKPRVGTANCFALAIAAIVKQDQRRHQIMCPRAAA